MRTFTYLNLYGYLTDAVVVNRVFPAEVDGYFGPWRDRQQAHLRGQVDHRRWSRLFDQLQHAGRLGNVRLRHAKAGVRGQGRHTLRLEGGIVVGVEVVNAHHRLATLKQPCTGGGADKTGRACHNGRHAREGSGGCARRRRPRVKRISDLATPARLV